MPHDLAHQFNPAACLADFIYSIAPRTVEIQDTGKGTRSVADDLESVLRKIEYWHQGSIAGHRVAFRNTQGTEHLVEWDGLTARLQH